MLLIDMPMPERCFSCPLSYWIMTGENAGRLMCNAQEANQKQDCLVDENLPRRPDDCPIKLEVVKSFGNRAKSNDNHAISEAMKWAERRP